MMEDYELKQVAKVIYNSFDDLTDAQQVAALLRTKAALKKAKPFLMPSPDDLAKEYMNSVVMDTEPEFITNIIGDTRSCKYHMAIALKSFQ